jgi:serine/threonine-protein kinase
MRLLMGRLLKYTLMLLVFVAVAAASTYLTVSYFIKGEKAVVVPDLIGKEIVYSLELLTDMGLNIKIGGFEFNEAIPKNHIIDQKPSAGEEIKRARDVRLVLSKGPKQVIVPNLVGMDVRQARIILEENELCEGHSARVGSRLLSRDQVIAQTPPPGGPIARRSCIDLLVSGGQSAAAMLMPNLVGLAFDDALLQLEKTQLSLGTVATSIDDGLANMVLNQKPAFGERVTEGQAIDITLSAKTASTRPENVFSPKRSTLFRYRLPQGFLKRHVRLQLNGFGQAITLVDDHLKPGTEFWSLLPRVENVSLMLYIDGELVASYH